MIGFPDEKREMVFDTINLNRQIKADSINGFVFQPYRGAYLRDYCIKKGYLPEDNTMIDNPIGSSVLNMPQLSKEAEELNEKGDKVLAELKEIFFEKYFV